MLADRGVYFDPNIGLVTQNYLENRARFLRHRQLQRRRASPRWRRRSAMKDAMFTAALKTPELKIVMGTDAVAGAHGQNIREVLERVKSGQQPIADAINSLTSISAESHGLGRQIGTIAPGFAADLVAVAGQPARRCRCAAPGRVRDEGRKGLPGADAVGGAMRGAATWMDVS